MSRKCNPFARSMAPRRTASFHMLLPPSMTTSPGESRPASVTTASSVAAPAGSMTQIARDGAMATTIAGRLSTAVAPSAASAARAAGSRSNAKHWCPAPSSRRTMLPPMRPSPIMPSCTFLSLIQSVRA